MRDTAQRLRAIDKKARRQMRHRAKDQTIEGVITSTAASLRSVPQRNINVTQLFDKATRDMGRRVDLTNRWHDGNVEAGKARRRLNDWELDTSPAGPATAWAPKRARSAVGKCDVDNVSKLNKAKRG